MNMMLRIQTEARRRGLRLENLSAHEYDQIAKDIRSLGELARDGIARYTGEAKKQLGHIVSLPVLQKREAICRENKCGLFLVLKDGEPACNGCNCSGKHLRTKWALPGESCPLDQPLWGPENAV